ncbi:hypothetical protein Q5H91_09030 [Sphingomonas sp. KR1UV-12]|uniref:Uncharacterized protein n=1 Tax=Sphingomonas aurea TaxID=3063994 RepID=A0ABT9EK53_9SPHN|nr:hypothetical protein [Sphingomonas sp. KR1UV-12]MDP1027355.1 hypothetical protein [Sphingomonas sp. KR1UV-12]
MRRLLLPAALLAATPATAAPLTITKTVTMVSDPLGNLLPRSLPGSVADYRTRAENPTANLLKPVGDIVLLEELPANVDLRVADLNAGKGPVEFSDGSLLGTGLAASGLTYAFTALASTTDGLEFYNGTSWAYQPVADADGYDRNVRAIRVKLGATFATGTSFQLRYRVRIR